MFRFFSIILCVLVSVCISCKKDNSPINDDKEETTFAEEKSVELNVQVNGPDVKKQELNLESRDNPQPVAEQRVNPSENFFFSGRTDLLSLKSEGYILAEGFDLGPLYAAITATEAERRIIDTCDILFDSIVEENLAIQYLDPQMKLEIVEYYNYFINKKLTIEQCIFGKPTITGERAFLKAFLKPENLSANIYLIKTKDREWLISGLEIDLRSERNNLTTEKWAPTVKPPIFGNY